MEKFSVDRIEGNFYILESENNTYIDVPKDQVEHAREGDIVFLSSDGVYRVDLNETEKQKKELYKLQNSIFNEE